MTWRDALVCASIGFLAFSCGRQATHEVVATSSTDAVSDVAASPSAEAIWGGGSAFRVTERLAANDPAPPYEMFAVFDQGWKDSRSQWKSPKPATFSFSEIGYWRMTPALLADVRTTRPVYSSAQVGGSTKATFGAACTGIFRRLPTAHIYPRPGWHVVRDDRIKREVPVKFTNPAVGGGGVEFSIPPQHDFSLKTIGLDPNATYMADSSCCWSCPYSHVDSRKPDKAGKQDFTRYKMEPFLLVEFDTIELAKDGSQQKVTLTQPTGWAIVAGRFTRV